MIFTHFNKTQSKIIFLSIVTLLSSLSGFIYLRNKQGTEYCKITAHISNSSPLVFSFLCLVLLWFDGSRHPMVSFRFIDHFESYPCMLG